MLNRSKIWAALLLLGVFAAGIAIGGPVWNTFGDDQGEERSRHGSSQESRSREHKSYSERLQEDLSLTSEQRTAIDSILGANQSEMRVVWREMRSKIDTLRREVSEEIMQLLDDEQTTKYTAMLERSRRRGERDRAPRESGNHE